MYALQFNFEMKEKSYTLKGNLTLGLDQFILSMSPKLFKQSKEADWVYLELE